MHCNSLEHTLCGWKCLIKTVVRPEKIKGLKFLRVSGVVYNNTVLMGSVRRSKIFKSLIFFTPGVSRQRIFVTNVGSMVRRSARNSGRNSLPRTKLDWTYVGRGVKSVDAPQAAAVGEVVESDYVIIDDKGNALGSRFTLTKVAGGHVYGSISRDDGSVFEVKRTSGHIFVPIMTGSTKRRRTKSSKNATATTDESNKKKKKAKTSKKTRKTPVNKPFKVPHVVVPNEEEEKKQRSEDVQKAEVQKAEVEKAEVQKAEVQKADVLKAPAPFSSFTELASTKKPVWIHADEVITMMQDFLPGLDDTKWTIKRLCTGILEKKRIPCRKGVNAVEMARTIDFYLGNGKEDDKNVIEDQKNKRWSAKLDMARLLMVMLGDEDSRQKYIQSRQLMTRQRLDDTSLRSVKVEYWIDVAKTYNDPSHSVTIDVNDEMATMYLRRVMDTRFRVQWTANKLREQFRVLRADYESSRELRNYVASGQNSTNFYPDFQSKNPSHVLLHYLLEGTAHGAVLGDVPKAVGMDTNKSFVDMSQDDNGEVLPHTPQVINRRRRRSRSPAMSIGSTASSSSMKDATKHFQTACKTLVSSFQSNLRKSQPDSSLDSGERALRLVKTKRNLRQTIKQLQEDGDADVEDDIRLLQMNLTQVSKEIHDLAGV